MRHADGPLLEDAELGIEGSAGTRVRNLDSFRHLYDIRIEAVQFGPLLGSGSCPELIKNLAEKRTFKEMKLHMIFVTFCNST